MIKQNIIEKKNHHKSEINKLTKLKNFLKTLVVQLTKTKKSKMFFFSTKVIFQNRPHTNIAVIVYLTLMIKIGSHNLDCAIKKEFIKPKLTFLFRADPSHRKLRQQSTTCNMSNCLVWRQGDFLLILFPTRELINLMGNFPSLTYLSPIPSLTMKNVYLTKRPR